MATFESLTDSMSPIQEPAANPIPEITRQWNGREIEKTSKPPHAWLVLEFPLELPPPAYIPRIEQRFVEVRSGGFSSVEKVLERNNLRFASRLEQTSVWSSREIKQISRPERAWLMLPIDIPSEIPNLEERVIEIDTNDNRVIAGMLERYGLGNSAYSSPFDSQGTLV
jgi:hypothetical protein